MKNSLTLGSLFDGSGGFPLGGLLAGITPVWASEIEPFPIRVTTKRLPGMKHYGDISQMHGGKIEPVDIITFGSPCTDMSVAGKRAGLDGQQSSLFYQAIRIIREMRDATNGKYPRYIVWENVVGAYSSNGGKDFKAVLEAVIGIVEPGTEVPPPEKNRWPYADCYVGDGWSVAYRTFDAQHWGVPQRRKRIYLVADFGGECAGKILFESEGMSGYSAESFRAWQRAAGSAENCAGTAGRICLNDQGGTQMNVTDSISGTLRAEAHGHPPLVLAAGFCTEPSAKARSIGYEEEKAPTLRAEAIPAAVVLESHPMDSRIRIDESGVIQTLSSRMGTGGGNVPLLMESPRAYGICSKDSNAMKSDNPHSGFYEADTSRTLDGNGGNPSCNQGGIAIVAFTQNQCDEVRNLGEHSAAVCANAGMRQQTFVLQGSMIGRSDKNGPQGDGINKDVSFTLNTVDRHAINQGYSVRKLTPTECAKLQGFPPQWCADLKTPEPTEEDIVFWSEVWETHRKIIGRSTKPKSQNQIIKWLKNPHSDSAEYKMWGNGVALPCVFFVLAGIVWSTQISDE